MDYIDCIIAAEGNHYLCCAPAERDEVLRGGAFWVEPRKLSSQEARELLQGREAPELAAKP